MDGQKRFRVVHCGSGPTGRVTLMALLNNPEMDLVGHLVFSPEKGGRDSGEISQLGRELGVTATRDIDSLIALQPDIFTYVGNGVAEAESSVETCCRFLAAGIDVSTPCLFFLIHPDSADQSHVGRIREACAKGNSSCFLTGSDPGFFSPYLAIAMLKGADEVNQVVMQELGNYAYHNVPFIMREIFGFGREKDWIGPMTEGTWTRHAWGGTVNTVADALDVKLDDVRTYCLRETHDVTHQCLWGTVEAGTVAAVRLGLEGIYKGKPLIVLEHVTRSCMEAAPDWPAPHGGEMDKEKLRHEYTVLIKGDPDYDCRIALGETRSGDDAGLYNTGALVVNAIPGVIAAESGILTDIDISMQVTRNIKV